MTKQQFIEEKVKEIDELLASFYHTQPSSITVARLVLEKAKQLAEECIEYGFNEGVGVGTNQVDKL